MLIYQKNGYFQNLFGTLEERALQRPPLLMESNVSAILSFVDKNGRPACGESGFVRPLPNWSS